MSEEKLYTVKDDEGKYWDFEDQDGFWKLSTVGLAVADEESAKSVAHDHGGHVVTFVEEPKKVVLSKEQAAIVENAHDSGYPATEIFSGTDSGAGEEDLLINAYVNGYTVAKEKKYRVLTPKSWWASANDPEHMHMDVCSGIGAYAGADDDTGFTQKQLDLYGLNGAPFTKEEVTDDDK